MSVLEQFFVFMSFFAIGVFSFDLLINNLAMKRFDKEMEAIEKTSKKDVRIYTFDDFKK